MLEEEAEKSMFGSCKGEERNTQQKYATEEEISPETIKIV